MEDRNDQDAEQFAEGWITTGYAEIEGKKIELGHVAGVVAIDVPPSLFRVAKPVTLLIALALLFLAPGFAAAQTSPPIPIIGSCTLSRTISLAGAGSTEIVPLVANKRIYICHVSLSTTASEDIKLVQGTGANCAGAPSDLTGVYKSVLAIALDLFGMLKTGSGQALCVNQSAAQVTGGVVIYAQY